MLLAAGFVRAADRLDPLTKNLGLDGDKPVAMAAVEPCNVPCDINDPT